MPRRTKHTSDSAPGATIYQFMKGLNDFPSQNSSAPPKLHQTSRLSWRESHHFFQYKKNSSGLQTPTAVRFATYRALMACCSSKTIQRKRFLRCACSRPPPSENHLIRRTLLDTSRENISICVSATRVQGLTSYFYAKSNTLTEPIGAPLRPSTVHTGQCCPPLASI